MLKADFKRRAAKEEEKKDRIKKLHNSVSRLILNAASEDGDCTAKSVPKSCESFFNQESVGLAEEELAAMLSEAGYDDVGFSHGVIQSLYQGHFLSFDAGSPSNLAPFCFFEKLSDESDSRARMLAHIRARDGKAKSNEEIDESLKQVVVAPSSYAQLKEQSEIFHAVVAIFFGKNSKAPEKWADFIEDLKINKSELKHLIAADSKLPTKILFAAHTKMQRWLKQCKTASCRDEVADNVLKLSRIIDDMLDSRLFVSLPSCFRQVTREVGPEAEKSRKRPGAHLVGGDD